MGDDQARHFGPVEVAQVLALSFDPDRFAAVRAERYEQPVLVSGRKCSEQSLNLGRPIVAVVCLR